MLINDIDNASILLCFYTSIVVFHCYLINDIDNASILLLLYFIVTSLMTIDNYTSIVVFHYYLINDIDNASILLLLYFVVTSLMISIMLLYFYCCISLLPH